MQILTRQTKSLAMEFAKNILVALMQAEVRQLACECRFIFSIWRDGVRVLR
jgi:hypothetical protein